MADETSSQEEIGEGPNPVKLVVLGVVAVYFVLLIIFNNDQTEVDLVFWSTEMPLYVVLLLAAVLGALLGQAAMVLYRRSRARD